MKNTPLYGEIKAKFAEVLEAEANAAAWKNEAKERMKPVNILIRAAQQMNPTITIDRKALLVQITDELISEKKEPQEAPEAVEETAETPDSPATVTD